MSGLPWAYPLGWCRICGCILDPEHNGECAFSWEEAQARGGFQNTERKERDHEEHEHR